MTTEQSEKVSIEKEVMEQFNGHESRQSNASNAVYKSRRETDKKVSVSLHRSMGELS